MNPAVKFLLYLGLVLLAGGGLFYAVSIQQDQYGLAAAGLGLALILAAAVLAKNELSGALRGRSARLGLGAGVSVVVVLGLAVFVSALSIRHHVRWDFSKGAKNTLAPQTLQVLKSLKKPVEALAFFRETQAGRLEAQETLDRYAYANRLFSFRFVDPDQNPALAKRYEVRNYGTVVLAGYGKEEKVALPEEQALTGALIKLMRDKAKVVYFLTGHGERAIDAIGREDFSSLKKDIEGQNYKVKALNLATAEKVPGDASVVIAAGPKRPLLEPEIKRLGEYLAAGGGFFLMLEPDNDAGLTMFLSERGIKVTEDIVLDQASRLFGASPAWPLALEYGDHEITAPLEGVFCYFPLCRSVILDPKLPQGVTGVELVRSSPNSWAETDLENLEGGANYDEGSDRKGPVSLGVVVNLPPAKADEKGKAAEKPKAEAPPKRGGRLVVLGDADFANNTHLNQAGNRDLALNSISFLAEEGDLVSIRPKDEASQPMLLQPGQARLVFWVPVVCIPLAILILGVVVVIRRRRPA